MGKTPVNTTSDGSISPITLSHNCHEMRLEDIGHGRAVTSTASTILYAPIQMKASDVFNERPTECTKSEGAQKVGTKRKKEEPASFLLGERHGQKNVNLLFMLEPGRF